MRTKQRTTNMFTSLLIFGYIVAVLLISGLSRADESLPAEVAPISDLGKR